MSVMFIGKRKITKCQDCPGYEWQGENIREGNCGYRCEFGGYSSNYEDNKKIPKNCPLAPLNNLEMVKADFLEENCGGCMYIDINDNKDNHCYLHKTMVVGCENKE